MSPDFHIEPAMFEAPEIDPSSRPMDKPKSDLGKAASPRPAPRIVPLPPGTHTTGAAGTTTGIIRLPR